MHGSVDPDPLAGLFATDKPPSLALNTEHDSRGILTRVVDQTQHVAGMFTGMGDLMFDIMSHSPEKAVSGGQQVRGSKAAVPDAPPLRLKFFRLDEKCKVVEEEYCCKDTTKAAKDSAAGATSKEEFFYVF